MLPRPQPAAAAGDLRITYSHNIETSFSGVDIVHAQMPIQANESWDAYVENPRRAKRVVSEKGIVKNCLHLLLGLKSEFFKITSDDTFMINSEVLKTLFCPHLSNLVIKNLLKEIATQASVVHAVRLAVLDHRTSIHKTSLVITKWGTDLLDTLHAWVRNHIDKPDISILDVAIYLRRNTKPFRDLLRAKNVAETEDDTQFAEYCGGLFVLSEPPTSEVRKLMLLLRPECTSERLGHDATDLVFTPEIFTIPATLIEESDESGVNSKTFMICYVNENRIVSY